MNINTIIQTMSEEDIVNCLEQNANDLLQATEENLEPQYIEHLRIEQLTFLIAFIVKYRENSSSARDVVMKTSEFDEASLQLRQLYLANNLTELADEIDRLRENLNAYNALEIARKVIDRLIDHNSTVIESSFNKQQFLQTERAQDERFRLPFHVKTVDVGITERPIRPKKSNHLKMVGGTEFEPD